MSMLVCVVVKSVKIKRCKCFCVYYFNSIVIFYCLFEGDLVFKLNFGFLGWLILIIMFVCDELG